MTFDLCHGALLERWSADFDWKIMVRVLDVWWRRDDAKYVLRLDRKVTSLYAEENLSLTSFTR